jgi:hypothetical protein
MQERSDFVFIYIFMYDSIVSFICMYDVGCRSIVCI